MTSGRRRASHLITPSHTGLSAPPSPAHAFHEENALEFDAEWQADEERVDRLLKDAGRFVGALKAWKKACKRGRKRGQPS